MTMTLTPAQQQALLDGPGLAPPKGQTTNYDNPESIAWAFDLTLGLGLSLTTLAILMRVYTKFALVKHFGLEDYSVVLGWVLYIGFSTAIHLCVDYGGVHQWNTHLRDVFIMHHRLFVSQLIYRPTIFSVKLSILLQYLRIFAPNRGINKFVFWGCQILIWSNFLVYFVHFWVLLFGCSPVAFMWNKLIDGSCNNVDAGAMFVAIFNVISDFSILVLPWYSISKLKMPLRRKLGICAVFGTGLLACIGSVGHLVWSVFIVYRPDMTWYATGLESWANAEIAIGILCACLPISPKFVRTVGPKIYSFSTLSGRLSRRSPKPMGSDPMKSPVGSPLNSPAIHSPRNISEKKLTVETGPYDSQKQLDTLAEEYSPEAWEMKMSPGLKGDSGVHC